MKRFKLKVAACIFAVAFVLFLVPKQDVHASYTGLMPVNGAWYLMVDDQVAYDYNGLYYDANCGWWLVQNGMVNFGYNGLYCDANCGWWLIQNGTVAFGYNGLYCDANCGWWLIQNGTVAFGYNGLYCDANCGWWLIQGGTVAFGYNGLYCDANCGWWLISGGSVNFGYTGLYCDANCGWWLIQGGTVGFGYNGLYYDANCGWWLVSGGSVAFGYTGLFNDAAVGWWYVSGGAIDFGFNGVAYNQYGGWQVVNGQPTALLNCGMIVDGAGVWRFQKGGQIDYDYTGMAQNEYGWWYYRNGTIDFGYRGIGRNPNGAYYFNNGQIDWGYTGEYRDGDVTYSVVGGVATAKASRNVLLATFYNSREDSSDAIYASFDGYTFYYLGDTLTDSNKWDQYDDLATQSPYLMAQSGAVGLANTNWKVYTQRDPSLIYKNGYFWTTSTARGTGSNNQKFMTFWVRSEDLVNWSLTCAGMTNGIDLNTAEFLWLQPSQPAPATNAQGGYDAVASDAFVDDDGTVWLVVSTGRYTDDHNNRLAPYLVKVTGMNVTPGTDLTTINGKIFNSNFNVQYGPMVAINLPTYYGNQTWSHGNYDYDGSIFKRNGRYYYVVQHSGEMVQLWSIDDLNQVSNPNAWHLENANMIDGSEAPCVVEFNGKNIMYVDRFAGWPFDDIWGNGYGLTAVTSPTLTNDGYQYPQSERITLLDQYGNKRPGRHGTVMKVTDSHAIDVVLNAYYRMGYK